jgi:hypothetical protein
MQATTEGMPLMVITIRKGTSFILRKQVARFSAQITLEDTFLEALPQDLLVPLFSEDITHVS